MDFEDNLGDLQRKAAETREGEFMRKMTFESLSIDKGHRLIDIGKSLGGKC